MPMLKFGWAKKVPAPMLVLAAAIPLGFVFDLEHQHVYKWWSHNYDIGPKYLIQLPGSLLASLAYPDFSQIFTGPSIKYIIMFSLVGSIESLLSVTAVDSLDPERRTSDLNRDLLAAGIGNTIAAAIGGLPMISEIVRSKANIDNGARSRWSNFFHGTFLLASLVLIPGVLQHIPLAALAAMLIYTGTRLASPKEFSHAYHIGIEQLVVFVTTMMVTLATDLLVGVGAGLLLEIAIHIKNGAPSAVCSRPISKRLASATAGAWLFMTPPSSPTTSAFSASWRQCRKAWSGLKSTSPRRGSSITLFSTSCMPWPMNGRLGGRWLSLDWRTMRPTRLITRQPGGVGPFLREPCTR
jgi:MFS superfamily sulfate permease-like transporter